MKWGTENLTGRNNCLNLLKCIACIGVVFVHVTFPGTFGEIVKYTASAFAVPLFFMIAGYYSFGCTYNKIKKRFIKIVKILVFAIIWWFLYRSVLNIQDNTIIEWLASIFTWKTLVKFFAFCTISWAIPLWYLIAMAETYFVWMFIVQYKAEAKATNLTYLFFALGAILSVIVDTFGLNWSYKINFICRAMPWFMFGYLVKERYESELPDIKNTTLLSIAIVGWIISLSAIILKTPVNYYYVGVLLTAPSLFLIGVKNSNIRISRAVEYIAEKLSLFIYIFHSIVSAGVKTIVKTAGIDTSGVYNYIHPVLTLAATIAVAMVFSYIFKNKKLKAIIS